MDQRKRIFRTFIELFLVIGLLAVPAAATSAEENGVVTVMPSVRLGPLGETSVYSLGIGGRASLALPLEYVPLSGRVGVGFYGFGPSADVVDFGTALMLIPELGVDYVIPFELGSLGGRATIGASYRHYINWHTMMTETFVTSRPIASGSLGVDLIFGGTFGAGLGVAYDFVFEQEPRHIIEPGLLLTLSF